MWKPSHFISIPIAYAVIIVLALLSRRWKPETRLWVYRGILIMLFVAEAIKQILGLTSGSYPLNYVPLHFSSSFYVSYALYAFGKGKIRQTGVCASFVCGFFLFFTMTASPTSVVGDTSDIFTAYVRAHSYFYHVLVLLFWAMLLAQDAYHPQRGDYLRLGIYLGGWAALAIPGSYLLNINYAGILVSYISILEKVRDAAGDVVYLLVYGGIAFGASSLFLWCYARIRFLLFNRSIRKMIITRENEKI